MIVAVVVGNRLPSMHYIFCQLQDMLGGGVRYGKNIFFLRVSIFATKFLDLPWLKKVPLLPSRPL